MRTAKQINADLARAHDSYSRRAFRKELGRVMAKGAKNCDVCGTQALGVQTGATVEIQCPHCNGPKAQGATVANAVANWNKDELV